MAEYTKFGLSVKTKPLGPPARTQTWLAKELQEMTGLYVDDSYISKILTGQRNAPKIVRAIQDILELPRKGGESRVKNRLWYRGSGKEKGRAFPEGRRSTWYH